MTRLLFAAEQPLLAAGLEMVLGNCPGCEIRRVALSPQSWKQAVAEWMPEVAVLEWTAGADWDPVGELLEAAPRCRVLLLLGNLTPETLFQAREAGVAGAIGAHATPEELVDAVRRVQAGEFVFDHGVDWPRGTRSIRLTRRESDLICQLVHGLKNKEIAAALALTEGTVKVYLCKLFKKVGAKDRFELALFGLRNLSQNGGAVGRRNHDGGEARLRSLVVSPQDEERARLTA